MLDIRGKPLPLSVLLYREFLAGLFLTTGHVLKDGDFSSIPSTYDQHTKPFAYDAKESK